MSIVSVEQLQLLRPTWRQAGQRLVFTNGIFDLLHRGHITYLEQARTLGDLLVVGLNSDASTRALKGDLRPLMAEDDRAYVLAALRCVDYVTIFSQLTAEALVQTLQPDIYVKGGDYAQSPQAPQEPSFDRLPEARLVQQYQGQVVLLPYLAGYATTAMIARIVARFGHIDKPG